MESVDRVLVARALSCHSPKVFLVSFTGGFFTGAGVEPLRGGVKTRPPPPGPVTTTPGPTGAEVTVLPGAEAVGFFDTGGPFVLVVVLLVVVLLVV